MCLDSNPLRMTIFLNTWVLSMRKPMRYQFISNLVKRQIKLTQLWVVGLNQEGLVTSGWQYLLLVEAQAFRTPASKVARCYLEILIRTLIQKVVLTRRVTLHYSRRIVIQIKTSQFKRNKKHPNLSLTRGTILDKGTKVLSNTSSAITTPMTASVDPTIQNRLLTIKCWVTMAT